MKHQVKEWAIIIWPKKISKACGALAKIRNCVSIDVLKNVYHALVHSYLRYGILVWGHAAPSVLKPLEILANEAIRIMTFVPFVAVDLKPVLYLSIIF